MEEAESGRERESAPVPLSVACPASVHHRRQRSVQQTTPVQFMAAGPVGPIGLRVLLGASVSGTMLSSSPPNCDIAPALTPPLPMTQRHLETIALETNSRPWTAASSQTVQWTAAGGRGLRLGRAQSPVGRGFSCQSGGVIVPPLNMAADSVTDRALRAASVRVPVQSTGSGPGGLSGVSVLLHVSHNAKLLSELASASAQTPPLPPARLAEIARVTTGREKTATTCRTAQWTEVGDLGLPCLPVLLPVG